MNLSMSSYKAEVLSDKKSLTHMLGVQLYAAGDESELVAASWHKELNIVVMVCYFEDPSFPQVKILNCETGDVFDLDCSDLIDSPIIQDITLLEAPGELELEFSADGDRRVVFYNLLDKLVTWQ